jgi:hypothetical protein
MWERFIPPSLPGRRLAKAPLPRRLPQLFQRCLRSLAATSKALQTCDNRVASHTLVLCDDAQDRNERSEPDRVVFRNGDPLVSRLRCLEDDVAANLMYFGISPPATSRTRRRRILSGRGRSKKNADVASSTFVRNCSHVSPSVKMFSVRHSAQYPASPSCTISKTNSGIPV